MKHDLFIDGNVKEYTWTIKTGKKFIDNGATILGGCCETGPKHVSVLSELK